MENWQSRVDGLCYDLAIVNLQKSGQLLSLASRAFLDGHDLAKWSQGFSIGVDLVDDLLSFSFELFSEETALLLLRFVLLLDRIRLQVEVESRLFVVRVA